MTRNIIFVNDIYQNAEMGIIGINDVLYKVRDGGLKKELEKEKKNYQKILKACEKILKEYKCKAKKINFMAKMSSEFVSEMKLNKENADDVILKMMIEGSYKSVGILTTKLMEYDDVDSKVKAIGEKLLKLINDNLKALKNFDKIC